MYAHVQLGVRNLRAMVAFYDAVLAEVGLSRFTSLERMGPAGVVWPNPGLRWPQFVLNEPFDGKPATTANGSQISLLCASRDEVDAAWNAALRHCATDVGKPGLRPRYAPDFYAAYCLDPEGHKLCFVHTGP
ncbi:MAG: VOC family protein [Acidovorax sp.]|uniref:VOC family protein n=1 Tax=Acidovorax sp. TaxID=1872122 RepID=UPI0025BC1913|nr:VOC family protein [Acidovorax sp.]MCE1191044.1 VOC family protein [Acidovorax sp.]